jgi:hypothetical protein
MKRALMTASGMACGAALTMILHEGSPREIAGAACLSLAMLIAATILPDLRRRAMRPQPPRAANLNMESWLR